MCHLLEYFCDQELQHRVESLAAFAERYVDKLQSNQRGRYGLLMKAFTMSAAETARRTREFRSPPQEQVLTPKLQLVSLNPNLDLPQSQLIHVCHLQNWCLTLEIMY